MTVRAPLSEVLTTEITQPTPATVFIVADQGTEGTLSVANAITLLGTVGPKGDQGIPGYWGSVGYTGSTGTVGAQGITGFTGSTGTQGVIGWTGSRGYNGSVGFVGSQGDIGVGVAGSRGYTGSTGTQGNVGYTGSIGAPGQNFYTATNVAGGVAGAILIQRDSSSTAFISTGSNGSLLQYNSVNNTATWVSTSTLFVNKATNSDNEYITGLTSADINPTKYITLVNGVSGYYGAGAIADLAYNTNNKILTSPKMAITSTTNSVSTTTGALVVAGGVGIQGDLQVGGTITANKLVIQYTTVTTVSVVTDDVTTINNATNAISTATGALIVQGGVGIGKDLWVGGVIHGVVSGGVASTTNLANGNTGQMPFQTAPGTTAFIGAGVAGQLLVSSGASVIGPLFRSTSTISVGGAVNLLGGAPGSLPYQSAANLTAFLAPGANGTVLTSNGTSLSWQAAAAASRATTATNIANGNAGQLAYQSAPGITAFAATGTVGQILLSNGTNAGGPVFTNTSSIKVNASVTADNLGGGLAGYIPIQSATGQTQFIATGTIGQILQMQANNTATWAFATDITSGYANTTTHIKNGNVGQLPFQTAPGITSFVGAGTAGQLLLSNGANSSGPSFANTSSIKVNASVTADNLGGGLVGYIPIQSANGQTQFIGTGTVGQVLQMQANNTATWADIGAVSASSTATNIAGGSAGRIAYQTGPGQTGFASSGTQGNVLVAGGGIYGTPVFQNTLTLAGTTVSTSTNTGALTVAGGVGIGGDLRIGGNLYINGVGNFGVSSLIAGTDTSISTSSGAVTIWDTSTLQSVSNRGSTTTNAISITNATASTSTTTGALTVTGGVGIKGNVYAGLIYSNGNLVLTSSGGGFASSIIAGTDTSISTSSGAVTIWNTSTLQSVTDRGFTTTNRINITNATASTSSTTGALIVSGGIGVSGSLNIGGSTASTSTTTGALTVAGGVGIKGDLYVGGQIYGLSEITAYYGTPSDIRLKTNITNIDNGLAKVLTLSGITYNLIADQDAPRKEAGVIAQELLKVLPEVVVERADGFLTVKYDRIIPLLIEAIKDLSTEIEVLKKRIP